jgi:hypothetical protein
MNSFCMHWVWDSSHEIAPAAQTQFLSHVFVLFLCLWFMCFFSSLNCCASTEHSTVIQGFRAATVPHPWLPWCRFQAFSSEIAWATCAWMPLVPYSFGMFWACGPSEMMWHVDFLDYVKLIRFVCFHPCHTWDDLKFFLGPISWDSLVAEYVVGMVGPTCPIKKHIHSHTFTRW